MSTPLRLLYEAEVAAIRQVWASRAREHVEVAVSRLEQIVSLPPVDPRGIVSALRDVEETMVRDLASLPGVAVSMLPRQSVYVTLAGSDLDIQPLIASTSRALRGNLDWVGIADLWAARWPAICAAALPPRRDVWTPIAEVYFRACAIAGRRGGSGDRLPLEEVEALDGLREEMLIHTERLGEITPVRIGRPGQYAWLFPGEEDAS